MRTLYSYLLPCLGRVAATLLGLLLSYPSLAQNELASQLISATNVTNAPAAVDNSSTTFAQVTPPVQTTGGVGGTAQLRMGFAQPTLQGSQAGVLLQPEGQLSLSALSSMVINTYAPAADGSLSQQQTFAVSSLVSLSLLNAGSPVAVQFAVGKPFTQLELVATGVVNAYTIDVFDAFGSAAAPLPVELTSFSGYAQGGAGVGLRWQTASEVNSAYFVVERATPAQPTFEALGQVLAAGTSQQAQQYAFTDAAPATVNYYRLRQVDRNGQQTFSAVVTVHLPLVASPVLQAYPSPVRDCLLLRGGPAGGQLLILNQLGQLVQRLPFEGALTEQPVSVGQLPAGVYVVCDPVTGQRARFVKASD